MSGDECMIMNGLYKLILGNAFPVAFVFCASFGVNEELDSPSIACEDV